MKLGSAVFLCGLLASAAVLWAATALLAQDGGAAKSDAATSGAAQQEPAKTDAAKGDKPQEKTASDETKKDTKTEGAKTQEAKPQPVDPYQRKTADVEKLVADGKKVLEKIPEMESKVNEQVSKMTDSAKKPVEVEKLREELEKNSLSQNARTYRDLTLALVGQYAKAFGFFNRALLGCRQLEGMKTTNDDLKKNAETLTASVKEQCISILLKMAGLYERIANKDNVAACYRQILAIDKTNSQALQYFKDLQSKEKSASGDNGSSSGYGNQGKPNTDGYKNTGRHY